MGADTMCCAARAGHGPRRSPPRPGRRVCRAPDRSAAGPRVPSALGLPASAFGLPPLSPPPHPVPSARAALRPPAPVALSLRRPRAAAAPAAVSRRAADGSDRAAAARARAPRRSAAHFAQFAGVSSFPDKRAAAHRDTFAHRESGNPLRCRGRLGIFAPAIECIASEAPPESARGAAARCGRGIDRRPAEDGGAARAVVCVCSSRRGVSSEGLTRATRSFAAMNSFAPRICVRFGGPRAPKCSRGRGWGELLPQDTERSNGRRHRDRSRQVSLSRRYLSTLRLCNHCWRLWLLMCQM